MNYFEKFGSIENSVIMLDRDNSKYWSIFIKQNIYICICMCRATRIRVYHLSWRRRRGWCDLAKGTLY